MFSSRTVRAIGGRGRLHATDRRGRRRSRSVRIRPCGRRYNACGDLVLGSVKAGIRMADFGLFLGFGAPRSGREVQASKVFEEVMAYYTGLK